MRSAKLFVLICFTVACVCVGDYPPRAAHAADHGKEGPTSTDEFSFLEDADNPVTRAWIEAQNERTAKALHNERFRRYSEIALRALDVPDSFSSIAAPWTLSLYNGWVYQHWTDAQHARGIWRRTRLESFLAAKPVWQTLLDVDALSHQEKKSWLFGEASFSPNGKRCLVRLSDGGSQVIESREFDIEKREFVAGGFLVPAARFAYAEWRDDATLLVLADLGPATLTVTGEPLVIKQWARGETLTDAREVFRGKSDDSSTEVYLHEDFGTTKPGSRRTVTFLSRDKDGVHTWWQANGEGGVERMTLPPQIRSINLSLGHYFFTSHSDWTIGGRTWKAGDLLSIPASQIANAEPTVRVALAPGRDGEIEYVLKVRGGLFVISSTLGASALWAVKPSSSGWQTARIPLPPNGTIVPSMFDNGSGSGFVLYQNYLEPPTLYRVDAGSLAAVPVAASVPQFNASSFVTEQWEAKSADGALVPYFVTRRKDMPFDGAAAALVHGYGAAGGSLSPSYSATVGKLWLEAGGVYVDANVRGGAERGASWHVKGVQRERTYEDMIAVVEDLIRRRITSAKRVGVTGESAGGLLAAVVINQRPDLFGAAVLRVPLVDQFRMDLAMGTPGSSYGEYGSPEDRVGLAFLQRTSPFQNLQRTRDFPVPLIITAANDQNVYPAQARRYAAKMERLGLPFYFYEAAEGAHAAAVNRREQARLDAMIFTYLTEQLMAAGAGRAEFREPY